MLENARIEELKKRVARDPTSIAFAQLAEEYRRGGAHQQAVDVCRDGLLRHPGYVSARVTMARSLMELGQRAEAKRELQGVIAVAPDNLAAIRALAEIHQKAGDVEETFQVEMRSPTPPVPAALAPLERTPPIEEPPVVEEAALPVPSLDLPPMSNADPVLTQLKGWLDAILADRSQPR